jgi:hypothetical protein
MNNILIFTLGVFVGFLISITLITAFLLGKEEGERVK